MQSFIRKIKITKEINKLKDEYPSGKLSNFCPYLQDNPEKSKEDFRVLELKSKNEDLG